MAYRSKLMRLAALLAFACILTTQTYGQDVGGAAPDMSADLVDDGPEDKDPKEINQIEIIHRRNLQLQANRLINEATQLLEGEDKDYLEAIDKYVNAEKQLKQISESHPDVLTQLKELKKILGSTYRDYAKQLLAIAIDEVQLDKFQESSENITKAIQYDPSLRPEAQVLIKLIKQKKEQAEIEEKTRPDTIDPEYQTRLKEILIDKSVAKVFHKHRIWKRARDSYESILLRDPANEEAIAGLRRIYTELRESAKMRRRAQEAERMSEIEWKWIDSIPPKDIAGSGRGLGSATKRVEKDDVDSAVRKKLETIVISKISFADARVSTVFEFLKNRSRSIDATGEGVNFMLILRPAGNNTAGAAPTAGGTPADDDDDWAADDDDDFGDDDDDLGDDDDDFGAAEPEAFGSDFGDSSADTYQEPTITMDFDNIPLGQAIKYICEQANLRYKIEEHAIVILGADVEIGNLELRFFPIDPRIFSASSGDDDDDGGAVDYKSFFEKMGVSWPTMSSGEAASISYDKGTSQLIVRNTPDNLRLMDQILRKMNIPIPQVTIEAKFVEVRQNSLEELSFKWVFNGHRGGSKRYQSGNVDVDVNPGAFTDTTRSMNQIAGTALTETFNLDTIIGASAFDTLVYFLNRKDGTDVLSAPKVTVMSGQEAFISMVEERMFPESFEEAEFNSNGQNNNVGFTPSSPVFGEPRQDLGVTLTVTPQVGNDNLSINLELHPKVVAFLGYDVTFNSTTNLGVDQNGDQIQVENRYDTPIFETRELRTTVTVWDGESVVLGGTITDELLKVNDKVPLLGDLPFLGRLFQSKGEQSKKKNLLMFVSARIIDPAGIPLRDHAIRGLPDYRR